MEGNNIDSQPLSMEDIEAAVQKSLQNFGRPNQNQIIFNLPSVSFHPKYDPLPWADMFFLSKKQEAVAKLHILLFKLKCLKNMTDEDHMAVTMR